MCSTSAAATPAAVRARASASVPLAFGLSAALTLFKQALARQFQKLYEAAHGEDPEGFAELAEKATAEELTKAAALSTALAQVNAAVDMYELTAKQLKLAATTSITIKTEVTDHE